MGPQAWRTITADEVCVGDTIRVSGEDSFTVKDITEPDGRIGNGYEDRYLYLMVDFASSLLPENESRWSRYYLARNNVWVERYT